MLPIIWLVAGVVLLVAEVLTVDFVLVMFAIGALVAAGGAALHLSVPIQVVLFAVVSLLGLIFARPAIKRRLHRGADTLAVGLEAIVGSAASVVEEVADDRGRVKIDSELWQARPAVAGEIIGAGARVRVIRVEGATAFVGRD